MTFHLRHDIGTELRVAGVYVLVGGLWIIFSDKALLMLFHDKEMITWLQTFKGWFFVLMTGVLIFSMVRIDNRKKNRLLKDIQRAQENSRESERLKSAFLANMSHEIRTPLNGILGFSQLIKNEELSDEERSEYFDIIHDSGVQLLGMINDLIDVSKLEAGQMVVKKKEFSLNTMFSDLHNSFKQEMMKNGVRNIDFLLDIPPGVDFVLCSDAQRIKQILTHLLSNSFKFTKRGTICLNIKKVNNDHVKISVEDTGRGISSDKLDHVFEPFIQEESSMSRNYGGTGIGLSLCKELVELLDGTITVSSKKGVGTCFSIVLPVN